VAWHTVPSMSYKLRSALRRQVLAEEPTCRVCGAPATEVDHITSRASIAASMPGPEDFLREVSDRRGTCKRCVTAATLTRRSRSFLMLASALGSCGRRARRACQPASSRWTPAYFAARRCTSTKRSAMRTASAAIQASTRVAISRTRITAAASPISLSARHTSSYTRARAERCQRRVSAIDEAQTRVAVTLSSVRQFEDVQPGGHGRVEDGALVFSEPDQHRSYLGSFGAWAGLR
jgi:hypothetical protein